MLRLPAERAILCGFTDIDLVEVGNEGERPSPRQLNVILNTRPGHLR